MLTARRSHGVTLIEMLIGLTVLGILLALGLPAFSTFMQNQRVRNTADAVLNGMQLARSEAIRRNRPVEFKLDTQGGWVVSVPSISGDAGKVQERPAAENGGSVGITAESGGATTITFDAMGGPTTNADNTNAIRTLVFTPSSTSSATRTLKIVVSVSGTIRMCDPSSDLPSTDPRRCASS